MTGIFINARLGSRRLPEKHLRIVLGRTFMEWLLDKYIFSFGEHILRNELRIFIVTSILPENKKFEQLIASRSEYCSIFYGSDGNIPLRQLQCAISNSVDQIISVDGDDILCSTAASDLVRQKLKSGSSFVKTSGLPLGMNAMGYSRKYLEESMQTFREKEKLETGWGKIFSDEDATLIQLGNYDQDERLRFTLDYDQDKKFFQEIIEDLGEKIFSMPDAELISFVIDNEIFQINSSLNETYWKNFYESKNNE